MTAQSYLRICFYGVSPPKPSIERKGRSESRLGRSQGSRYPLISRTLILSFETGCCHDSARGRSVLRCGVNVQDDIVLYLTIPDTVPGRRFVSFLGSRVDRKCGWATLLHYCITPGRIRSFTAGPQFPAMPAS
jgi:hypothetical protein